MNVWKAIEINTQRLKAALDLVPDLTWIAKQKTVYPNGDMNKILIQFIDMDHPAEYGLNLFHEGTDIPEDKLYEAYEISLNWTICYGLGILAMDKLAAKLTTMLNKVLPDGTITNKLYVEGGIETVFHNKSLRPYIIIRNLGNDIVDPESGEIWITEKNLGRGNIEIKLNDWKHFSSSINDWHGLFDIGGEFIAHLDTNSGYEVSQAVGNIRTNIANIVCNLVKTLLVGTEQRIGS